MLTEAALGEILSRKDETTRIELKLRYVFSGQGKGKAVDEVAKDIIAITNTSWDWRAGSCELAFG